MKTSNKEYYVYALIDPRNDEYFYIGKGKGKRYNDHLNEKIKDVTNIFKHSRIRQIQAENQQVKVEILFSNLTEQTAFNLEKIIIYKIGRKSFREGKLLNIVQGGKWSPGDSLFYEKKLNIDFDLTQLDSVAQEKFHSITKTSNIIHLNEINPEYFIHTYDLKGTLISIDNIGCFYKDKNFIDLFFELNQEKLPIYNSRFIYSKEPINNFYFSECLISLKCHLVDPQFLKEIDEKISINKDFTLELKQNEQSRIKVNFYTNIFKIQSNYPNNQIQKIQFKKNGKPYGTWYEYYENGIIKYVSKYFESGKRQISEHYNELGIISFRTENFENGKTKKSLDYYSNGTLHIYQEHCVEGLMVFSKFYFPNGKLKFEYGNFNQKIKYSYYDDCGNLIEEFINNKGYVLYNKKHEIISVKNSKHMDFIDPFKVLKPYFPNSLSNDTIKKEKRISDEDWEIYQDFLNKQHNK